MPTNFYFNNFPQHQITSEQLLVEDLVIEAMQIHGMDVYYLPQTSRDQVDMLYGEDTLKEFRSAYGIEMYLENVSGMDGEGDFISKFGLEIRDEVTLLMSRRRFASLGTSLIRPREGDLVYIPLLQNFFEISFVEHDLVKKLFLLALMKLMTRYLIVTNVQLYHLQTQQYFRQVLALLFLAKSYIKVLH
jgi:hypothetical protein